MANQETILLAVERNALLLCLKDLCCDSGVDNTSLAEALLVLERSGKISIANNLLASDTEEIEYHHLYRIKELLGLVIEKFQGTFQNLSHLLVACLAVGNHRSGEANWRVTPLCSALVYTLARLSAT